MLVTGSYKDVSDNVNIPLFFQIRDIQAEEARIGAIQGGAPSGAFAGATTMTGQPYILSTPGGNPLHQPTYPPGVGLGSEPYYPPAQDTPDMTRE